MGHPSLFLILYTLHSFSFCTSITVYDLPIPPFPSFPPSLSLLLICTFPTPPTLRTINQSLTNIPRATRNFLFILTRSHTNKSTIMGLQIYDFVSFFFTVLLDIFFREIRPRGAHKVPKQGPVIFVAAPHANQVK